MHRQARPSDLPRPLDPHCMSPRGWGSKREFIYRREPTHCQGPHAPTISWESAEREREREREGEIYIDVYYKN
ncbi:MAG: hypothetical protein ACK55Z_26995, partial [bacterium]